MSTEYDLMAEARQDIGKGASRRLRHQDKVPGIIYGTKEKPQAIVFEHKFLSKVLAEESSFSKILTLKIGEKSEQVLIKALQRHHYKPKFIHIDLLRVNLSEKLTTHVPLHFIGEETAPGIKDEGGIISHLKTDVEVSCLPKDLPEQITIDVSNLNLGDSFTLSQIQLPKGVELTHAPEAGSDEDQPVASIAAAKEEPVEAAPVASETDSTEDSTEQSADDKKSDEADSSKEDKKD